MPVADQRLTCSRCGRAFAGEPDAGSLCPVCNPTLVLPLQQTFAVPADPLIGQALGQFEIIELIGRGTMGAVYKAHQASLARLVAVKVLSEALAADPKFVAHFERQARATAGVNHPNVIAVIEVGEERGRHYVAMEYVDGESLAAILEREGRVAPARAASLLKQSVAALAAAHHAGVIHYDVKPSNILVDSRGEVRLTDFGLARGGEPGTTTSARGHALGAAAYAPPEVATGQPLDARADLYSLGATFFHALAGRPPFEGDDPTALLVRQATEQAPSLSEAAPDVDPRLARVIDQLLAKRPEERVASAKALLDCLEALGPFQMPDEAGQAKARAALLDSPTLAMGAGQRLRGRNPRRMAIAAAGALVLLAAALLLVRGFGREPAARTAKPGSSTPTIPAAPPDRERKAPREEPTPDPPKAEGEWVSLFDGKSLDGWRRVEQFPGSPASVGGQVRVADGQIVLEAAEHHTAIAWTREFPETDYEITAEAMRVAGAIDFGSMVFPVAGSRCIWMVGGYGLGACTGLEMLDGRNAGSNETTRWMRFEVGRWYAIRLRVTKDRIEAWIDGAKTVNLPIAGHSLADRDFSTPMAPFGIFTYQTTAALRNLRLRRLKPEAEAPAPAPPVVPTAAQVEAALRADNPAYVGPSEFGIRDGTITEIDLRQRGIRHLGALKGLSLTKLKCDKNQIADLSPLRGMPLAELVCGDNQIADLSPLAGLPLTFLICYSNHITDLGPLRGLPLRSLYASRNNIRDLSPLRAMPLTRLCCCDCQVADLSPLQGMALTLLHLYRNPVSDLQALKGMPLTELEIGWSKVADLSPLRGMPLRKLGASGLDIADLSVLLDLPLEALAFSPDRVKGDLGFLRRHKSLRFLGAGVHSRDAKTPAAAFWNTWDARGQKDLPPKP